jgi:hypothetical protein
MRVALVVLVVFGLTVFTMQAAVVEVRGTQETAAMVVSAEVAEVINLLSQAVQQAQVVGRLVMLAVTEALSTTTELLPEQAVVERTQVAVAVEVNKVVIRVGWVILGTAVLES